MRRVTNAAIPLIAVLLTLGTTPSHAQLLNTINNKIDALTTKIDTVRNNTNGLPGVVSAVQGMDDGFRPEVLTNLRNSLAEAQDIAEFIRADRVAAGSPSNYPDLSNFILSLETIINVLKDDPGNEVSFGILTSLLQILPDQLLAGTGKALSKAGIDGEFINRLTQLAADLAVLQEGLKQDAAEQQAVARLELATSGFQPNGAPLPVAGIDPLPAPTQCNYFNSHRLELKRVSTGLLSVGTTMKVTGEILAGVAKTVQTTNQIAIWGWVGAEVGTDPKGAIGKVTAGIGEGVIQLANFGYTRLRHCEILYGQQALLREVCGLSRFRSVQCQALGL